MDNIRKATAAVPGLVGGSETYARELTRALARVGSLDYRVFVPSVAPDAGDGLRSSIVLYALIALFYVLSSTLWSGSAS